MSLSNYHCRVAINCKTDAFLDRVDRGPPVLAASPSLQSIHPGNIVKSHTRACSNIITRFAAESNANIAKSRKHFVNQLLPSIRNQLGITTFCGILLISPVKSLSS